MKGVAGVVIVIVAIVVVVIVALPVLPVGVVFFFIIFSPSDICRYRSMSATLLATPLTVPLPPYGLLSLPHEYPSKSSPSSGRIATCPPSGWRRPCMGMEFTIRPTPTPVPMVTYDRDVSGFSPPPRTS